MLSRPDQAAVCIVLGSKRKQRQLLHVVSVFRSCHQFVWSYHQNIEQVQYEIDKALLFVVCLANQAKGKLFVCIAVLVFYVCYEI